MSVTVRGTITIDPPLRWAALRDDPLIAAAGPLRVEITENPEDTDDGVLHRRAGVALAAGLTERIQRRSGRPAAATARVTAETYRDLVADFVGRHPGHEYLGYLEFVGEHDAARVVLVDGKAAVDTPVQLWRYDPTQYTAMVGVLDEGHDTLRQDAPISSIAGYTIERFYDALAAGNAAADGAVPK